MFKFKWFILAALMLGVVVITACGSPAQAGSSVVQVTIQATDQFRFVPDVINAKPGQQIQLTLQNTGSLDHSFVLPDLNINYQLPAGKTLKETFSAPSKAGTYQFYCNVPGHKEAGMVGNLIVK